MIKRKVKNPIIAIINNILNHGLENFGRYYSKYRAWVYDNNDPEGLGRLKLIIPQVSGPQFYNYWAFPSGVPSNENFGMQVIPQKGAMVWVEFEGGSPEIPIWSHGHFTRKEIPTDDKDLKDTQCYWFITQAGHRVKINDTKNYISIQSSKGDTVILDEKGFSIVTDKNISLGSLDGSEFHGVLGEKLVDLLTDINDVLTKLNSAFTKDILASTGQPFYKYTNLATAVPKITPEIKTLGDKLKVILSKPCNIE
jgi:hypothetical protein